MISSLYAIYQPAHAQCAACGAPAILLISGPASEPLCTGHFVARITAAYKSQDDTMYLGFRVLGWSYLVQDAARGQHLPERVQVTLEQLGGETERYYRPASDVGQRTAMTQQVPFDPIPQGAMVDRSLPAALQPRAGLDENVRAHAVTHYRAYGVILPSVHAKSVNNQQYQGAPVSMPPTGAYRPPRVQPGAPSPHPGSAFLNRSAAEIDAAVQALIAARTSGGITVPIAVPPPAPPVQLTPAEKVARGIFPVTAVLKAVTIPPSAPPAIAPAAPAPPDPEPDRYQRHLPGMVNWVREHMEKLVHG